MRKLLFTLATLLGFGFVASAQFQCLPGYGVEVEVVEIHDHAPGTPLSTLNGLVTYRVYATTVNATDRVSAVAGGDQAGNPILVATTTSFYQDALGGLIAGNINPAIFAPFPTALYDSWVTIGRAPGDAGGEVFAVIPPVFDWTAQFNAGGNIDINSTNSASIGGGWANTASTNSASEAGDDLRVLLGQFTTDGQLSGSLNIAVFPQGVQDPQSVCFFEFEAILGCTDATATNFDPAATNDDGSCEFVTCDVDAGSLLSTDEVFCSQNNPMLVATVDVAPTVPAGYSVIYVLTSGNGLVIQAVSDSPSFSVSEPGAYTIHTLVYDPATLDLGIVTPGSTTGFDVNGLLIQGGGDICAALDVAGAAFFVEECLEGCTSMDACNYDAAAIIDNGSCEFVIDTDLAATSGVEVCDGDGSSTVVEFSAVYGSGNAPSAGVVVTTPSLAIVQVNVFDALAAGSTDDFELDFAGFGAGEYLVWYVTFWSIQNAGTGVNANNLTGCFELSNPVSVFVSAAGCTDPAAANFDAAACGDNGTCIFDPVFGCTDANACNFDSAADTDDSSCEYLSCCEAEAGSLSLVSASCVNEGGNATAAHSVEPTVPVGYTVAYVLTEGPGLVIIGLNEAPSFGGLWIGSYTIHTFVFPTELAATITGLVEFGVTTGFDVNALLAQGGGTICAALDVAGAPFSIEACQVVTGCTDMNACNFSGSATEDDGSCEYLSCCDATAGSLAIDGVLCVDEGGSGSAVVVTAPVVPMGYTVAYVLTEGPGLVIIGLSDSPSFSGLAVGSYTIHTFVFPTELAGTITGLVEFGVTTGFDVNALLAQGGGTICAALDVTGAPFTIEECPVVTGCIDDAACNFNPDAVEDDGSCEYLSCCDAAAGSIAITEVTCEGQGGSATAAFTSEPSVPEGYGVAFVLTEGPELVIIGLSDAPSFGGLEVGSYTIHTLVFPLELAGAIEGLVIPGVTTGFQVNALLAQGGGTICAALDVAGAPFTIQPCVEGCEIVCPENVTVDCAADLSPSALGMPSVVGLDCQGVQISYNGEQIGEGECIYTITRSWSIEIPGTSPQFCEQVITVTDFTGPEFIGLPESFTVSCVEEVPGPEMVSAEDACNSVTEVEIFTSETGAPIEECIASTAFGPGADWALWLPSLATDGLAASANFMASDLVFTKYNDGTARLTGIATNDLDGGQQFAIDFHFRDRRDWDQWSALGRSFKDSFGHAAAGGDLWTTWEFYEMVDDFSTLTGLGDFAGNILYAQHMPDNYYYGFQCGQAANDRNPNFGMSGWFTVTGVFNNEFITGHGDINVDKECEEIPLSECPNDTAVTYYYRAQDSCGNNTIASYTVTVLDEIAPEFTVAPQSFTIECSDELPLAEEAVVEATDNCECGVVSLEYLGEFAIEGGNSCEYQLERIWKAVDCCQNEAFHVQIITVV
ncbi:MAG: hypothetical protein ACFCUH_03645, partial [Flavobacteriales bacterium]